MASTSRAHADEPPRAARTMTRDDFDPAVFPGRAPHGAAGIRYVRIASPSATALRTPEPSPLADRGSRMADESLARNGSVLHSIAESQGSSLDRGFARSLRCSPIAAFAAGLTFAIAIARADLREPAGAEASTPNTPEIALSRRLLELRHIASESATPSPGVPPPVRRGSRSAPPPVPKQAAVPAEHANPTGIPTVIEGGGDEETTDPLQGLLVKSGLRWLDPRTSPYGLREIRSILGERHAMLADRGAPGEAIEVPVGGQLADGWNIAAIDDAGVTLLSPKGNPLYLKPSGAMAAEKAGP